MRNSLSLILVFQLLAALGCGDDKPNTNAGTGGDASVDAQIDSGSDTGTPDSGGAGGDEDAEVGGIGGMAGEGGSSGAAGTGATGGTGGTAACVDADNDGHMAMSCGGRDCNDSNAAIHPGSREVCNNQADDDCSSLTTDLPDFDRDGFDCLADCNDDVRTVNPSRSEVCGNGIDDDCNPATPDLLDLDNDGFSCDVDCDDTRASIHPAADEVCGTGVDEDCDPFTLDTGDADGDGLACDVDCDDDNANLPDADHYCVGTFSYFEGFETDDGGWTMAGVNATWERGMPGGEVITGAAGGSFAWVTGITALGYNNDEDSALTSPSFSFASLTSDPVLRFARIVDSEANYDTLSVEVSIDGGVTWDRVPESAIDQNFYPNSSAGFSGSSPWLTTVALLVGTAGESDVRIRFSVKADYSVNAEGFGIDNVRITEEIRDLSLDAVELPEARCADRSSEEVTVSVTNRSSSSITSFSVSYSVDGATPVVEQVATALDAGESTTHSLSVPANLAAVGRHVIRAWVSPTEGRDENPLNDESQATTHTFAQATALDYRESFEGGAGQWVALGTRSSWARGTPVGDPIDGAGDGSYAFVTNPYGVHNPDEDSALFSPCFDFSGFTTDPVIAFLHAYSLDTYDTHTLEVAVNGGAFEKLGSTTSVGASGWYNNASYQAWNDVSGARGVWVGAHHPLTDTAGEAQVQIRFTLTTDSTQYAGAGVDDIRILDDLVDPQVTAPNLPSVLCAGQSAPVSLTVFNGGNNPLANFDVSYQLDSATPVVETFAGPIAVGASESYTFNARVSASTPGTHMLTVRSLAQGQLMGGMNSVTRTLTLRPSVNALGYHEDFEAGAGGWTSGGDTTWVRGRPLPLSATVITNAASGEYAWLTNLRGDYANSIRIQLDSPCFDFTGVNSDPQVELAHIRDTEFGYDGAWLEISTNGGTTFTKLGSSSTGTNWYNNSSRQWWGGSSDAGTWSTSRSPLVGVANNPSVLFRFVFTSDSSSTGEGVGIDDFAIVP